MVEVVALLNCHSRRWARGSGSVKPDDFHCTGYTHASADSYRMCSSWPNSIYSTLPLTDGSVGWQSACCWWSSQVKASPVQSWCCFLIFFYFLFLFFIFYFFLLFFFFLFFFNLFIYLFLFLFFLLFFFYFFFLVLVDC